MPLGLSIARDGQEGPEVLFAGALHPDDAKVRGIFLRAAQHQGYTGPPANHSAVALFLIAALEGQILKWDRQRRFETYRTAEPQEDSFA